VGLRPPDVSVHVWRPRARTRRLRPVWWPLRRLGLDAGALQLDHRLSAVGPPFLGGVAALDAHTCAVGEQPVNLDEGDQYDWPWLYAVEVGHWDLTDAQAKAIREYLLRGGFFMCDDFHGTEEWEVFTRSMQRVFPDRAIVEIDSKDPIFHTIYNLDDRFQVPGEQYVRSHRTYEYDGFVPHWRGIYDDKGRLMVAICFDMDLGDSWEHADNPQYPEKFSGMGIRIGVNYVMYSMTH